MLSGTDHAPRWCIRGLKTRFKNIAVLKQITARKKPCQRFTTFRAKSPGGIIVEIKMTTGTPMQRARWVNDRIEPTQEHNTSVDERQNS